MSKRIISLLLVLVMAFGLVACGAPAAEAPAATEAPKAEAPTATKAPAATEAPAAEPKDTIVYAQMADCGNVVNYLTSDDRISMSMLAYINDGLFTLNATRCLGACGLAPVIMVNDDVYGRLTPDQVPGIIAKYRQ